MDKPELIKKPITLLKEDFVNNLINLCNNSDLPFFIIESVISNLLKDIHIASEKQLESDRIKYNKELSELQLQSSSTEDGD